MILLLNFSVFKFGKIDSKRAFKSICLYVHLRVDLKVNLEFRIICKYILNMIYPEDN